MNTLRLGRTLGDVTTPAFQRYFQQELLQSLDHHDITTFNFIRASANAEDDSEQTVKPRAHTAGTNCLALDPQQGRFIVSGGADSTIRLWDLESCLPSASNSLSRDPTSFLPTATLARSVKDSHTHALTSVSIYPFDPVATTLLSTSHDKTLLLSQITPTNLQPIHKFNLDFTPYTHTISPIPSATPLVAVGTAHPAVRLLDLRSGLSTHSLPGHNGAIYALQFSPRHEHVLLSGSADGRILAFDIRRANPAFASLDLDDAVGLTTNPHESRPTSQHLNFAARAHTGPVTGLAIPTSDPTKLVSAGHDQRLRVWDLPSGRNELVHFGPRIRNGRAGNLTPTLCPAGFGRPGKELLFWPNDDGAGRGEVFIHSLREGHLLRVMRTRGLDRGNHAPRKKTDVVSSGGRINGLVLRVNARTGHGVEMYSAHGDGRICAWFPTATAAGTGVASEEDSVEIESDPTAHSGAGGEGEGEESTLDAEQTRKKRKRDMINDLVQGLTKRPVTFSS